MDKLIEQLHLAIQRYFSSLATFGYKSEGDTKKLLIFMYITDMLQGPFTQYITEDDYDLINIALYTLYGTTCLLPYPMYAVNTSVLNTQRVGFSLRFTEIEQIRNTQGLLFRDTE